MADKNVRCALDKTNQHEVKGKKKDNDEKNLFGYVQYINEKSSNR